MTWMALFTEEGGGDGRRTREIEGEELFLKDQLG